MSEVKVDTISERTAAGGVTIDGVLLKDSIVNTDNIAEKTAAAGVTIDGVLVKDGVATFQTAAGSPLVFEGATADAFETTFAITDPTADRTITFPDESITLSAGGDNTPYFSAYVNTTYTVTSDTHVTVAMDTEYADSDNAFDTSTYEFTVPTGKGGSYWLGAYLTAQGEASDMRDARVSIKVNDVKKLESNFDYQNNYINISCPSCFGILVLSEDDVLKVETWTFTYHSSGLVEIMGGAGSGAGAQCGFIGYKLIG